MRGLKGGMKLMLDDGFMELKVEHSMDISLCIYVCMIDMISGLTELKVVAVKNEREATCEVRTGGNIIYR